MQKKSRQELKEPETEGDDSPSIVLRTLLRKDIHKRLTKFAKEFSTGYEKWDYGVAIQILLDCYDHYSKVVSMNDISMKIDHLLDNVPVHEEVEKPSMKLLGGHKEEI